MGLAPNVGLDHSAGEQTLLLGRNQALQRGVVGVSDLRPALVLVREYLLMRRLLWNVGCSALHCLVQLLGLVFGLLSWMLNLPGDGHVDRFVSVLLGVHHIRIGNVFQFRRGVLVVGAGEVVFSCQDGVIALKLHRNLVLIQVVNQPLNGVVADVLEMDFEAVIFNCLLRDADLAQVAVLELLLLLVIEKLVILFLGEEKVLWSETLRVFARGRVVVLIVLRTALVNPIGKLLGLVQSFLSHDRGLPEIGSGFKLVIARAHSFSLLLEFLTGLDLAEVARWASQDPRLLEH